MYYRDYDISELLSNVFGSMLLLILNVRSNKVNNTDKLELGYEIGANKNFMTLNNFRLKCLQNNDDGEKYITNVKEQNHVTSLTMSYDGLNLDK